MFNLLIFGHLCPNDKRYVTPFCLIDNIYDIASIRFLLYIAH